MRTRGLAGSRLAAAVGRPASGRHTRQNRPAAGRQRHRTVERSRGARRTRSRTARGAAPMPPSHHWKWLDAEEVAPSHFLAPSFSDTLGRKANASLQPWHNHGYTVLSPRTKNRARSRASARSVPRQLDPVASEHRAVAAGGRARAAYSPAGIPAAARYFAHDDQRVDDALPGRAGAGTL